MKAELLNQAFDIDELLLVLGELKERADNNAIIVEGLKDIESLNNLGFRKNLFHINNGQSLIDFCSGLRSEFTSVVILTDWDSKGNTICRSLQTDLRACDLRFDSMIRKRLSIILKREVKDVQSIYNFMKRNYPGHLEIFLEKNRMDDKFSETLARDCHSVSLQVDSNPSGKKCSENDPEVST